MGENGEHKSGFLTRLLHSEAGNTLALTAAATIPLIGMIGGAVDMSRAYLAKSRLQQACDAGALAGRREMSNGAWSDTANTSAKNFFDTNFTDGSYGTENRTVSFSESNQVVTGTASVSVPMTMMKLFGFGAKTLSVTCTAEMKIPNTDVMFVLDTTGSMASKASTYDTYTKIEALRNAVESFYNTLEAAKGSNTQIRYGFVPYSVNVNVGYLLKRDWMADNATYQSRKAKYNGTQTYSSNWSKVSGSYSSSTSNLSGSCPTDTYAYSDSISTSTTTDDYGYTTTVTTTTRTETGSKYSCTSKKVTQTKYSTYVSQKTDTVAPKYTWEYKAISYDVSGLKGSNSDGLMAGGSITANIGNMSSYTPTTRTVDWNGCIEERQTTSISSNYSTAPSGTNDLDIDTVPSTGDANTQWKPALAGLVFGRPHTSSTSSWSNTDPNEVTTDSNYYTPSGPCPTEARKLSAINSSDLTTYLDSLNPTGNTYHDIGMLWGARLISPNGLFASENTSTPNGGSISRHLIFMTDGATEPNNSVYTPYGLEPLDRRRIATASAHTTGTSGNLTAVVNARLDYLCTAVKNKNITVWVVAFGTTLTSNLSSCASPGRAYQANNSSELDAAFASIAAEISQLRLTQ